MIKRTIFAAKNHVYKTYKAMKKIKLMTLAMCLLSVVSCSTKQGTGAAIGAGGGAVLGGIIGNIIGKNSKSTADRKSVV